jgi:hypothetical protein
VCYWHCGHWAPHPCASHHQRVTLLSDRVDSHTRQRRSSSSFRLSHAPTSCRHASHHLAAAAAAAAAALALRGGGLDLTGLVKGCSHLSVRLCIVLAPGV